MLSHFPDNYIFENVYNLGNGRYAHLTDFFKFERANITIDEYFRRFVNTFILTFLSYFSSSAYTTYLCVAYPILLNG